MKGSLQIKKNNKYYVYVRINGKQKAIPTGIEAVRGNKRKAEAKMIEILAELDDNPHIYDKILFVDYAMKWLEYNQNHVDDNTHSGYKQYLQKHIIPYFEPLKRRLQDIKTTDIEGYYNHKSTNGRLDGKEGGLSKESIKRHSVVLNLIFKQALHDDLIKKNPCEFAKMSKIPQRHKESNIYTIEQCKKLLEVTEGELFHDIVYLTFMYGLRREEVMGLRWCDIDFNKNILTIQHTVTVAVDGNIIRKDKTKTESSNRIYPLLSDIREMLLNIKTRQEENKKIFGNCYSDTDYIFTKEDGALYYPTYPTHKLIKVTKKYNLPHITFHELRKSCVTMLLLDKNWSMKEVSEWVGHSDIYITMNMYAQITKNHKQDLANSLCGTLL